MQTAEAIGLCVIRAVVVSISILGAVTFRQQNAIESTEMRVNRSFDRCLSANSRQQTPVMYNFDSLRDSD